MKKLSIIFFVFLAPMLLSCSNNSKGHESDSNLIVNKRANPVLTKQNGLISDPSVIRDGSSLLMIYSDYSLETDSITFNVATSPDGIEWTPISSEDGFRIFSGDVNSWDKLIETPELVFINNEYHLYYIGYPESNFDNGIYESEIGLATGTQITSLQRVDSAPTIPRGGPKDQDALTSPTVINHNGLYYMMYTGWTDILTQQDF